MNSQKIRGVLLSFLCQVVSLIVGLAYTPIMIRILGQNEYGLYQLVQSIVNYLSLLNFGFSGAYIRYYSIAKSKNDNNKISQINGMFFKVFLVISFICVIAGIIILFNINVLGDRISESDYYTARILLIILVLNMSMSFPCSLFTAFMIANERFAFQKIIEVVLNLLIPLLNIPLLFWGFKSVGVVSVTLLLSVLRLIISCWYCFKKLSMRINVFYFDKRIFTDIFFYTFFIFLSDLIDQLNSNVDKFLLGRIKGTISVAIYSVGFYIRSFYTYLSWSFPEVFVPEVNKIVVDSKEDKTKLSNLFVLTGRVNNYVCLLIITGFLIVGKSFINLWVGKEYSNSYYVCIILMFASYIPSIQTLGINIQNAANLHKTRCIVYLFIAIFNIILSVFLINKWGEVGTALGTLVSVILGSGFFMNFYYSKIIKLNIRLFWKEISKWLCISTLLCLVFKAVFFKCSINNWVIFFAITISYTVIYILILWIIGISREERNLIKHKIKNIF